METTALGVLTAVESAHAFSAFLPSVFTIRTFAADPTAADRVRAGYPPAVAFAAALGLTVSYITRQPWPLLAALATAAGMVAVYEWALAGR